MKARKDTDWDLFELLEGELTPEQEAEVLQSIEANLDMESDWDFMQMTQLEAPKVVYKHKQQLLKKDTTLIAFSSIQWKRVAGIAAALVLCYPIWNYLVTTTETTDGIVGAANEVIPTEEVIPESSETIVAESTKKTIEDQSVEAMETVEAVKKSATEIAPVPKTNQTNHDLNTPFELVSASPRRSNVIVSHKSSALQNLPKATAHYNMADLIPTDDSRYEGIRATVNTSLAILTSPFRDSKIKIQPTDKKTLQIVYSSTQYSAIAMVSLKPLK